MRVRLCVAGGAAVFALITGLALPLVRAEARPGRMHQDEIPSAEKPMLKPEVAALIQKATAVYSAMKSYRHNSEYFSKVQDTDGEPRKTIVFTLALERPNKFVYKSDASALGAAICDGKTFLNYRVDGTPNENEHTYYTKTTAPASYKGINIVDDVTFTYGTYMVALMLQGDVLADKDVRAGLEKATLRAGVEENGKKYDVLNVPFESHSPPYKDHATQFYFEAGSHLLHKAIEEVPAEDSPTHAPYKVIEIMENILVDKPIPAGTFEYKLPKSARQIVSLPPKSSTFIATRRSDVGTHQFALR